MTISSPTKVGEVERKLSMNPKHDFPADPKPKGPALPEPKVESTNTERLREVLAQSDISLNFQRDEQTGRVVVQMIDNTTGEPVLQIPSEVSLRLSEMFARVQGQLFEARF